MSYKGDSPNKKMVRAHAWEFVREASAALDINPTGFYLLAGEGGDVSTLSSLLQGSTTSIAKAVTVVDIDKDCVDMCVDEFNCRGLVGEAGGMSSLANYNIAHMDFCNAITVDNLKTIRDVITNASEGPSLVMVTVMRGREPAPQANGALVPKLGRRERKMSQKKMGQILGIKGKVPYPGDQLWTHGKFSPRLALKRAEAYARYSEKRTGNYNGKNSAFKRDKLTIAGTSLVRVNTIVSCLNVSMFPDHIIEPLWLQGYHSNSKNSGGTPFVTCVLLAIPPEVSSSGGKAAINALGRKADAFMSERASRGETFASCLFAKRAQENLRDEVISCAKDLSSEVASDRYDIPVGRIRAWLAHASRGTYDGNSKKSSNE